jgi:hypothetical protein
MASALPSLKDLPRVQPRRVTRSSSAVSAAGSAINGCKLAELIPSHSKCNVPADFVWASRAAKVEHYLEGGDFGSWTEEQHPNPRFPAYTMRQDRFVISDAVRNLFQSDGIQLCERCGHLHVGNTHAPTVVPVCANCDTSHVGAVGVAESKEGRAQTRPEADR